LTEAILKYFRPGLEVRDGQQHTPLVWAFYSYQLSLVEPLLEKGADINTHDGSGHSLLVTMCITSQWPRAIWLVRHGANVQLVEAGARNTPFHFCCKPDFARRRDSHGRQCSSSEVTSTGRVQLILALLAARADINAQGENGNTPLMAACDSTQLHRDIRKGHAKGCPDSLEAWSAGE
jgi:ankyrin repeat protein